MQSPQFKNVFTNHNCFCPNCKNYGRKIRHTIFMCSNNIKKTKTNKTRDIHGRNIMVKIGKGEPSKCVYFNLVYPTSYYAVETLENYFC